MCGLFGAIGPLPPGAVDAAARALAHRGPDLEGRFADGDVTLVHRRLKIIDLSPAAAQPMSGEDPSIQLVFNGEIYNHRSLRRELEAAGHSFKSRSDTEAIVHGYEEWGTDVVARLDGMFAFALWDGRRRRLLLARDRTGKKPLFWSEQGGVLRFGSTVASMRASGLETQVSVERLPFYLSLGYVPAPATLHAGVEQIAPGTFQVWQGRMGPPQCYWAPQFGRNRSSDSFGQAASRVRSLVEAAVERRLEADVPLGAFLSGGLDSTIVVGVMSRLLGSKVRTFSIGFAGDPRFDETSYARMAASAFDTEHTEFRLEPSSFELAETLVQQHDGPFGDSSAIPTYVVSRLTRQHVTVALTGDGGDELFCGYRRFVAAEIGERIPLPLRRLGTRLEGVLPAARSERSILGRARRFLAGSELPLPDRIARWTPFFHDPAALLRSDVRAQLGAVVDAPDVWRRALFAQTSGLAPLARIMDQNFRSYLPDDLLVKADRTSMAHGLELRAPFLDTALIEYAASLPPSYLRRWPDTKRVLKHAFRDLLPPAIGRRAKMGFGVPLGAWFRGELRPYLNDYLGPGARLEQYLDRAAVARFIDEHTRQQADHGHRLWSLLTLEIWLRSLHAARSATPVEASSYTVNTVSRAGARETSPAH
jgi:asparagine synthase (glutamine-hydrolysing)